MKNENNFATLYEEIKRIVAPECVRSQEPMSAHTTFKIGGPADIFVSPKTVNQLCHVLAFIHEKSAPLTILGCGSNVLVRDRGIRGVVVTLCEMNEPLSVVDTVITAPAGITLKALSEFACEQGLTGLEFAVGIPGTLGGAVFMNAGAYEGEMSMVVTEVSAATLEGEIRVYEKDELDFSYRHSVFQDTGHVISVVKLALKTGEKEKIRQKMDELTAKRESKQPLEMPSAGSTFKRPPGYYAGTLIEQTGLKGLSVGGAQISEKHAGFVVNKGGATAKDVQNLIREVQQKIKDVHNVILEPEVRIIGEE